MVIHRALVLPVSKQNMIQRQSGFRQPVRSVLNVKRSLKCPGPQLSQKLLGLWSALSTPETVLDILNQHRSLVWADCIFSNPAFSNPAHQLLVLGKYNVVILWSAA